MIKIIIAMNRNLQTTVNAVNHIVGLLSFLHLNDDNNNGLDHYQFVRPDTYINSE